MLKTSLRISQLTKQFPLKRMSSTLSRTEQSAEVISRKSNAARILELNRPKALNALNLNMINIMKTELESVQNSSLCKVVVLTNDENLKAFCSGGDVKTVVKEAKSGSFDNALNFFRTEYQLNHLLGTTKKPVIAIMNGITMGGGVGISVHNPFRIATEKTVFAMPETQIGLFPDVGGSFFLPRLDGEIGTYLGLTGHRLKGEEVFMAGIATHFVPSSRLSTLLTHLSDTTSDDYDVVNMILEDFVGDPIPYSQWQNWSLGGEKRTAIDRCFGFNTIEEIFDALQNEQSEWGEKTLKKLKTFSPTSLKVTLKQLRFGKHLSFADCFKMEYAMVHEFLKNHDFAEGVRALLVDKDQKPNWKPTFLDKEQLSEENIENTYFSILNPAAKSQKTTVALELLNNRTYLDYPHRTLSGLPSENDIQRVVSNEGLNTKQPLISYADVLNYFLLNWGKYDEKLMGQYVSRKNCSIDGGLGRGKVGLKEKVLSVLTKNAVEEKDKDGTVVGLKWSSPQSKL